MKQTNDLKHTYLNIPFAPFVTGERAGQNFCFTMKILSDTATVLTTFAVFFLHPWTLRRSLTMRLSVFLVPVFVNTLRNILGRISHNTKKNEKNTIKVG